MLNFLLVFVVCSVILMLIMVYHDLKNHLCGDLKQSPINYKEVWTLELKDTILLMNSADYNDRFVAEYFQVKVRAEKLSTLLKKYKDGTLDFKPKCSYEMLHEQLVYMENYKKVLEARAEIEGIDISEK